MIQIELKAIRINHALSEETYNYSASLYADGRLIGVVGNSGHGGCDRLISLADGVSRADYDTVRARVAAEHPKVPSGIEGMDDFTADLDMVCGDLIVFNIFEKETKSLLKKNVLYVGEDGSVKGYVVRKGYTVEQVFAQVRPKHSNVRWLNDMPVSEATRYWKASVETREKERANKMLAVG